MPSNSEFLSALFGDDAPWVHVTDFIFDPNEIPEDQHLRAWAGDYFSRYRFGQNTNQYFTISNFYADEKGKARRRKVLYRHTPVIVLDDVKEKLSLQEVQKLPAPAWILETSPGSEQWGYILTQPCSDRAKIENLLDGLVANGLAPEGKDPGMKGVTRYVRLPDGVNTKKSKMVNGQPFQCRITHWMPFNRVRLEELAQPFSVDLEAPRREARVDGAARVDDHPLLQYPDLIHIKEVRSDGRFDITCPWVDEHTKGVDNGTAIFTNADGSMGFKCHHGACQDRTGRDLLNWLESQAPGFKQRLSGWQMVNTFADVSTVSFMGQPSTIAPLPPAVESKPQQIDSSDPDEFLKQVLRQLRGEAPNSKESIEIASRLLKAVDQLPEINRVVWHNDICDVMRWSKRDFEKIIKDLRGGWYQESKAEISFFDDTIFVAEQNRFFDRRKRIWYTPEAYQNTYAHLDSEARREALQGGRVTKVDKVDYAPLKPPVFTERGIIFGNSWTRTNELQGSPGDASPWLNHFDVIGWGEYREHILKWMAFTILHPDIKINHMIIMGSGEGAGKDFLLYPLAKAMADNYVVIGGEELIGNHNEFLLSAKYLNINETELGDRSDAIAVSSKLKPLAAKPPDTLRVNPKGVTAVSIRNIVNSTMTTNSQVPVRLNGHSRRMLALWSDFTIRDEWGNTYPEWSKYWKEHWNWMENGGAEACIYYLRNEVSLENFNPGEPPPVTQFLRDIVDASRTPLQQTIEGLIRMRTGTFRSDLVTTDDIMTTLKFSETMNSDRVYCSIKQLAPSRIQTTMKELRHLRIDAKTSDDYESVWVVRNHMRYKNMQPCDVLKAYRESMKKIKSEGSLGVVDPMGQVIR